MQAGGWSKGPALPPLCANGSRTQDLSISWKLLTDLYVRDLIRTDDSSHCRDKRGKLLAGHKKFNGTVSRDQIRIHTGAKRTLTEGNMLRAGKGVLDIKSQIAGALMQDGREVPSYLAIHAKDASGKAAKLVSSNCDAIYKSAASAAQRMILNS